MRIEDAKKAYSAHLDTLREKKRILTELMDHSENPNSGISNFDRVQISRELTEVEAQYNATQSVMDRILTAEYIAYQGAAIKQQSKDAAEGAEELGRILTIYRRIASGAKVPSTDERRLMEFSFDLYMAAKASAMLGQDNDEEYDSLWEDEDPRNPEGKSPEEIANETKIAVPSPQEVSVAAAER